MHETQTCAPDKGAKAASKHIVMHQTRGFEVWIWSGEPGSEEWLFGLSGTSPRTAHLLGWRYIGPSTLPLTDEAIKAAYKRGWGEFEDGRFVPAEQTPEETEALQRLQGTLADARARCDEDPEGTNRIRANWHEHRG